MALLTLLLMVSAARAAAQEPPPNDPLELQKRAVARIDSVIDRFRRTGDTRLQVSELLQAGAELSASNRALAARQNWSALAFGLIKQGHVYRLQGQWAEAIALYQSAQEAATRGRDVVRQSDALAWRALGESSRRNLGPAVSIATQAVNLAETTSDKDILAQALDVLGTAQVAQLNLVGAGETTNREVAVAEQAKDPTAAYYAYFNRSDVYLKLADQCDYNASFDACNQALDRAKSDLERASSIVRRLGYTGMVQQTDQFLRDVATRRALVQSHQSQHATLTNTGLFQPKKAGDVLVTEKFAAGAQPIPPALVALVQSQQQLARQFGALAAVADARIAYTNGVLAEMQGNNDAALGFYVKAIDALERDRRSLQDERGRGTYAGDRINFYYAAILQQLDRRRYADAFETMERSRSRALADLIASRKLGLARPEEQRLYAESALIRSQIADAQNNLLELVGVADASKHVTQLSDLNARIRTLEGQYQQVASRIATDAPRLQSLVDAKPASLKALQDTMRTERFELVQYLVQDAGVIVWHIGPDTVTARNVFLPRTQMMSKVASLRKSLSDRNAAFDETTARELFLYLIQPVLGQIHSERLVIVPHEDLNYVPFQAFQNPADGRYLGEHFQISYAPSATVLLGFKRSTTLRGGRLFAAADPSIVAAVGEVASIGKLFPGRSRVVSNALARESDVKAAVRDYDIVHLSVHGKFNATEPMLSYVVLAPGASDDGRLTAAEMFGLPLDNSRIVVLSACDTGRAEATHGNEVIGLVRALIYAGAGALVLSYWEVDSDATALWMRTFYEAALTRPIAEAARVALTRVKSDPAYSHPYYWAAFAMVGR